MTLRTERFDIRAGVGIIVTLPVAPGSAFSIDVVPPLRWHRPPSTITLDLDPDDADDCDRMDDDGGVQPGGTMVMDR